MALRQDRLRGECLAAYSCGCCAQAAQGCAIR